MSVRAVRPMTYMEVTHIPVWRKKWQCSCVSQETSDWCLIVILILTNVSLKVWAHLPLFGRFSWKNSRCFISRDLEFRVRRKISPHRFHANLPRWPTESGFCVCAALLTKDMDKTILLMWPQFYSSVSWGLYMSPCPKKLVSSGSGDLKTSHFFGFFRSVFLNWWVAEKKRVGRTTVLSGSRSVRVKETTTTKCNSKCFSKARLLFWKTRVEAVDSSVRLGSC